MPNHWVWILIGGRMMAAGAEVMLLGTGRVMGGSILPWPSRGD